MWKNGRLDRDAVWGGGSGGPKGRCIRWDPYPPKGNGQILLEMSWRTVTCRESGYVKTAELMELPFRMASCSRNCVQWGPDLPSRRSVWEFWCPLVSIGFFSAFTFHSGVPRKNLITFLFVVFELYVNETVSIGQY